MLFQPSVPQCAFVALVGVVFYWTLNPLSIIIYIAAVIFGFWSAPKIVTSSNLKILQEAVIFSFSLDKSENSTEPAPVKPLPAPPRRSRASSIRSSTSAASSGPPWEALKISVRVNDAMEEVVATIIENYINLWYKTDISADNAFVGEIQYQIRHAASVILKNSKDFDFAGFILEDIAPLVLVHVDRILQEIRKHHKQNLPPPLLEIQLLDAMPDLHFAMTSRENESDYLRAVADFLVDKLIDPSRVGGRPDDDVELPTPGINKKARPWPSLCVRHILREIVTSSILVPILDFFANPDTLNSLILALLEPQNDMESIPLIEIPPSEKTNFLAKLTESTPKLVPDSLLSLKLIDIVKDPKLLHRFYVYLHDIRGPAHFLDCFLQAHDLHNDVQTCETASSSFEEVHSDAWQLYSDYIHDSAPHHIRFEDSSIPEDFHRAVDAKDPNLMKKVTEAVYKDLYNRLNYPYVVPFCQSECYLGYLCGAPPDVVELVRPADDEADKRMQPPPPSSFSLSQFRNRLFQAFTNGVSFENGDEAEVADEFDADGNEMGPHGVMFDVNEEIGYDATDEDVFSGDGFIEDSQIALFDTGLNLNKWIITVPRIEPRKDPIDGRIFYVYILQMERLDLYTNGTIGTSSSSESGSYDELQTTWTLARKYEEFYTLEQQLIRFHGPATKLGTLPDRNIFQPKNRAFMDTQRQVFESFVQALCLEPNLKRSDLLYAFLTNDAELREGFDPTQLNPIHAMRRVPSKLQRERGQNLKPYLLNVLANVLAPTTYSAEAPSPAEEAAASASETSSLQSFLPHSASPECDPPGYSSKIALDNLELSRRKILNEDNSPSLKTPSDDFNRTPIDAAMFFMVRIAGMASDWYLATVNLLANLINLAFNAYVKYHLGRLLNRLIDEECLLTIVQQLQTFFTTSAYSRIVPSDEEKKLRAELTQRRLDAFLADNLPAAITNFIDEKQIRAIGKDVITAMQLPRMNKQLCLVLLDAIMLKVKSSCQIEVFDFADTVSPNACN
uniref:Sorting nexin-14 n=1 Tax=Panagrellus redivivus TaxID=6233 RepID=A0A7E4V7W4_PANRE